MTLYEVREIINDIAFNTGNDKWYTWDAHDTSYCDGEIRFHLVDYSNGDLKNILIGAASMDVPAYIELYPRDFTSISNMIYYMFSAECSSRLDNAINRVHNMIRKAER